MCEVGWWCVGPVCVRVYTYVYIYVYGESEHVTLISLSFSLLIYMRAALPSCVRMYVCI